MSDVDVILPPASTSVEVDELVVDDDRNLIASGDRVLLIVEDDVTFARIMLDLAHDRGLKGIVALRGSTAIALAREFKPSAMTLDVRLPDMSGWTLLDRLKHDPMLASIPVHIVSGHENNRRGFALGAMSCLQKALTKESLMEAFNIIQQSMMKRTKKLLLIAENDVRTSDIHALLRGDDLEFIDVATTAEAMDIVNKEHIDGIVLDWVLPDDAGVEFIEAVQTKLASHVPPIIVSGSRQLSDEQIATVHKCARNSAVRYAPTIERLLDEVVLLLHRNENALSLDQRKVLADVRQTDPMLSGRKVLVIDDDLRNIFALTSVLEQHELKVLHAENGRTGIELLKSTKDIDIVLMDIMMPEMDGYETSRAIRSIPQFESLPIIALTAKAMKGDREKCLQAGASDYVTKPVDLDHLFSVMRVWMARDADNRFEHGALSIPDWLADHDLVVDDDRNLIAPGDRVLLIVEDDITFARIMVDLSHQQGLRALIALRGSTAVALAREFKPGAITLDVRLPDMSGWTVLDYLKHDPLTRHIPVHVISGHENNRRGFVLGAMTCVQKEAGKEPLENVFGIIEHSMQVRTKKLLIVTATFPLRQEMTTFLAAPDLDVVHASSAAEAMQVVKSEYLDGIVLDWVTSDVAGIEFIEDVQSHLMPFVPPVIVFGARKLSPEQGANLHRVSRISSVRYAPSLERLLDETVLLLHRSETDLSEEQRRTLADERQTDTMLSGRKVLVIDDDVRNIFALTSVFQRNVGAGPAHIERDQIGGADQPGRVDAARNAAGRPGQHRADREPARLTDRRHPAMRLDDQGWPAISCLGQAALQPLQIAPQGRPDIGVDYGRRDTLKFLDLRPYIGGQRDIGPGQLAFDRLTAGVLVPRVAPCVEIANRYRLDPFALQHSDRLVERSRIERDLDSAIAAHALAHPQPQPARDELLGWRQPQVVAIVLQALAHLDDVAMALGRQQPDARATTLQQGVGCDRGAVDDALGFGKQCRAASTKPLRQPVESVEHADRWVIGGRGDLFQDRPAELIDRDEIGKGAADIDADAVHRSLPVIGVAGEDLLRAVELFQQHAANQKMRPSHRPQRHGRLGMFEDRGAKTLRPADRESEFTGAAVAPVRHLTCKIAARPQSAVLIEREERDARRQRLQDQFGFAFLDHDRRQTLA